jgi:3-oxoacyl-[acyl-carrier protein] reductase
VQAAAKYFMEQNYGKSSTSLPLRTGGNDGQINYAAAKGGILSFTMSAARELARFNVTANVISLGIVTTDMTEKITTDEN